MARSQIDADLKKWLVKVQKATRPSMSKKVLRKGAKVLQKEMKSIIKTEAKKTQPRPFTQRYKKGGGSVQATYYRGNLMRSIKVLNFKRSSAVFVGTKISKKGEGGGIFKGRRVDGYYAHMVNNGTEHFQGIHFLERASNAKGKIAKNVSIQEARKVLGFSARRYNLK